MVDRFETLAPSSSSRARRARAEGRRGGAPARGDRPPDPARRAPALGAGIGPLTSTALAGFVGDLHRFPSGRHFASYLGLTPRERSTGGTRRLGPITKRGDVYLRMLLTHGARAVLAAATQQRAPDPVRRWALAATARHGHSKATVAHANELARYAWAVATHEVPVGARAKAA